MLKGQPVESLLLTASAEKKENGGDTFFKNQKKIVLKNCGIVDPLSIDDALIHHAYEGLGRVLERKTDPESIIANPKDSGLKGRGGAGFPTWMKWDMTRKTPGEMKVIICNSDEGDPGAFMGPIHPGRRSPRTY